jgi:hypothetical protein
VAAGVLATWERALVDIGTAINYNPKRPMEAPKTKTFAARPTGLECGCSSGVEHNLAKVRVGRSIRLARSKLFNDFRLLTVDARAKSLPCRCQVSARSHN